MSHNTGTLAVSAVSPKTFATPGGTSFDAAPPTKRFNAIDLATALAAMAQPDFVDDESTITVSAEDNEMLLASSRGSFRGNAERPNTDDEPTLDVPSPAIPAGIPSPLGDDDVPPIAAGEVPKWLPDETLTLDALGLDLDDELTILTPNAPLGPESVPPMIAVQLASPVEGARSNREAVRVERADGQRTRSIVIAIWTIAVAMAAVFTYVLVTAESSNAYDANESPATPASATMETTDPTPR